MPKSQRSCVLDALTETAPGRVRPKLIPDARRAPHTEPLALSSAPVAVGSGLISVRNAFGQIRRAKRLGAISARVVSSAPVS